MSSQVAIQADRLGKLYEITPYHRDYPTLRAGLAEILSTPIRRLTKRRDEARLAASRFWALREVSFAVNEGEVLGVIGRNGAGKSTLLRLLSRITEPTEGEAWIRGTTASLLEVGTGFHPELTGRENVFLNGAILGISRNEMRKKLDQIVDYSGIEAFIDTPVKRYSSGMYVRLAFAVAAHVESDVLIVDEVLAVGDAEFQAKCVGTMDEESRGGRTILFTSHNLADIRRLCHRCLVLDGGRVLFNGDVETAIGMYSEGRAPSAVSSSA